MSYHDNETPGYDVCLELSSCQWPQWMLAVGGRRLASVGKECEGGRERCTLRRFRIRGLIEGMLRTVMGNICWGHKAQVGHGAQNHQANKFTRRPKEWNEPERGEEGKGKKQKNKWKREWTVRKKQGKGIESERWSRRRERENQKDSASLNRVAGPSEWSSVGLLYKYDDTVSY